MPKYIITLPDLISSQEDLLFVYLPSRPPWLRDQLLETVGPHAAGISNKPGVY